jgi:hypothetical protein
MKLKDLSPGTFLLCRACGNHACVLLMTEEPKAVTEHTWEVPLLRISERKGYYCCWNFRQNFNANCEFEVIARLE